MPAETDADLTTQARHMTFEEWKRRYFAQGDEFRASHAWLAATDAGAAEMERLKARVAELEGECVSLQQHASNSEEYEGRLKAERERDSLKVENERLRLRVLTAAGDDLCRLTPEEIKAYTSGAVQIPPKEEFIASCERFHAQIANTSGVLGDCLTLAQMVAENERLRGELAALRKAATEMHAAWFADHPRDIEEWSNAVEASAHRLDALLAPSEPKADK